MKIKKTKHENDKLRSLGAGLLLEYGLRSFGLTQSVKSEPQIQAAESEENDTKIWKQVHFKAGENGKPIIAEYPDIHFNLSHSGHFVAVIFGREPVGIDIEGVRKDKQKLAERFFMQEEKDYLKEHWSDALFTKIWTRKESFIKANGMGMKMPLNSFSVLQDEWKTNDKRYLMKSTQIEEDMWLSICMEASIDRMKNSRMTLDFEKELEEAVDIKLQKIDLKNIFAH